MKLTHTPTKTQQKQNKCLKAAGGEFKEGLTKSCFTKSSEYTVGSITLLKNQFSLQMTVVRWQEATAQMYHSVSAPLKPLI